MTAATTTRPSTKAPKPAGARGAGYLGEATTALANAVGSGPPGLGSNLAGVGLSGGAVGLIGAVEQAWRLAAVAAVDVLSEIDESRSFYEHGHASARVMFEHVGQVSGAESYRLDKIRRMTQVCDQIAVAWRKDELSVDKTALLARAFAHLRHRREPDQPQRSVR